MRRFVVFIVLALTVAACGKKDNPANNKPDVSSSPPVGTATETGVQYEPKAREVTLSFLKAIREKNVEQMLRLSTLPFINERQPFLETQAQLKSAFEQMAKGIEDPNLVPTDILRVQSLPISKPIANDEEKKQMEVLISMVGSGYLVIVGKGKSDDFLVLVTKKEGVVLVAGILP